MEQLAHVGSKVDRAIRAHDAGNESRLQNAITRALELFDLTAADERLARTAPPRDPARKGSQPPLNRPVIRCSPLSCSHRCRPDP